jgi:hypothetical protein
MSRTSTAYVHRYEAFIVRKTFIDINVPTSLCYTGVIISEL